MAGFDDEVGEDFVEGADCAREGWGVVAESYEEGGDWGGLFVRVGWYSWGGLWWTYDRLS